MGSVGHIGDTIHGKITQLHLMGDRLHLLQSHNALLLLHHSFSIYSQDSSYSLDGSMFPLSQIEAYDSLLKLLLSDVTNVNLDNNISWLQASLPLRAGSIDAQKATQLAPFAFLAFVASCSELFHEILPPWLHDLPNSFTEFVLAFWHQGYDKLPPSGVGVHCQKAWDATWIQATYDNLLAASPNQSA